MWRWIFGLVILLSLGGGGWWLVRNPQVLGADAASKKEAPTPTVTVELQDLEESLGASGEVRPSESTMVKSEVSGVVKVLNVAAGDYVKKNDLLLAIDPKELDSQLEAQKLAIRSIELRRDKCQRDWERNTALWDKKLLSGEDLNNSKTDLDMALNELEIQKANVKNIEQQLSKLKIHAPHDGIVLDLDAQIGAVIVGANSFSAGTVLMEIADMTRKKATINLNEIDVMKVHAGLPVEATFDSIPGLKLEGQITFVSPSAGNKSGQAANNSNVRTFPVTVNFDQNDDRIRAGITATIKIPLAKAIQVPALPIASVFGEEGTDKRYVFLQTTPDTFERRGITTGINNYECVEIKDGLREGDIVASERPKSLPAEPKKKNNDDWNP